MSLMNHTNPYYRDVEPSSGHHIKFEISFYTSSKFILRVIVLIWLEFALQT